jgi:hypothetical protein
MEIAALASFATLLIAWIVAPDRRRPTVAERVEVEVPAAEPEPMLEAA